MNEECGAIKHSEPPKNSLLEKFKKEGSHEGPFIDGIARLTQGDYPELSKLCPWAHDKNVLPDSLWINFSVVRKPDTGETVHRGGFYTWSRVGKRQTSAIYDLFSFNLEYREGDAHNKYLAQTHRSTVAEGRTTDASEQVLWEGEVDSNSAPDENFLNLVSEFMLLVREWEDFKKAISNQQVYFGQPKKTQW